jgi:hypothetical protein
MKKILVAATVAAAVALAVYALKKSEPPEPERRYHPF